MENTDFATVLDQRISTGTCGAYDVAPAAGAAMKAVRVRVDLLGGAVAGAERRAHATGLPVSDLPVSDRFAGDLLATPSTDDDTTGLPPRGAPV